MNRTMNCDDIQQAIPDLMDDPAVRDHLLGCESCWRFAEYHVALDARLIRALSAPSISPGFRDALRSKLPPHAPQNSWPDFLPDFAHLAGCAVAVAFLLFLLPHHLGAVMTGGSCFTVATYFFQAVVRNAFEPDL